MHLPHDPGPHWGEVGIHGLHRQREWDAVATLEGEADGDEVWFVVLADGTVVGEGGDADPASFRAAVSVAPPFRAHAVRRDGTTWAVAARRIETAELDDEPAGNEIEIAWDGAERSVRIAPTAIMSAAAKTAVGGSVSASIDCIARSALSG